VGRAAAARRAGAVHLGRRDRAGGPRSGFGEAALEALHAWAREQGYDRVGLHVFGNNDVARRLYLRTGYVETNVQMEKRL
jgi:ribosomal protein S18 acetylase RimI-like enzyme